MNGDHYFSAQPASADKRYSIMAKLAGREVALETAAGTFSPSRLDLGTQVLLRALPEPPARGNLLDLGCGWGPIAIHAGLQAPALDVWALDVNERALEVTAKNAAALGLKNIHAVTADALAPDLEFDTIWSNPPIRVGKEALHGLLTTWLPRLAVSGTAWLVVARKLGADSLVPWIAETLSAGEKQFSVRKSSSAKGYRVLVVERTG